MLVKMNRICVLKPVTKRVMGPQGVGQVQQMEPVAGSYREGWINPDHVIAVDPTNDGKTVVSMVNGQSLIDKPIGEVVWIVNGRMAL